MRASYIQQVKKILSPHNIDIYISALLELFLIVGMIISKGNVMQAPIFPIMIGLSMAMVITIFITENSKKTRLVSYTDPQISAIIMLKALLLFSLPRMILMMFQSPFLQILIILSIQAGATFFFYKAFKQELKLVPAFLKLSYHYSFKALTLHVASAKAGVLNLKNFRLEIPQIFLTKKKIPRLQ